MNEDAEQFEGGKPVKLSPHEVFGYNLRILIQERGTITAVAQELDINRVQLSRFIAGSSFPKPGLLKRICQYFEIDERILLTPLHVLRSQEQKPAPDTTFRDYLTRRATPEITMGKLFHIPEIPDGIHQIVTPCEEQEGVFVNNLCLIHQAGDIKTIYGRLLNRHATGKNLFSKARWAGILTCTAQGFALHYFDEDRQSFKSVAYFNAKYVRSTGLIQGRQVRFNDFENESIAPSPMAIRLLKQEAKVILSTARTVGFYKRHTLHPTLQKVIAGDHSVTPASASTRPFQVA